MGFLGRRWIEASACLALAALAFFANAGCEITTFGNLTTTGTSGGGGGGSGGGGSSFGPHLLEASFTVPPNTEGNVQAIPAVAYIEPETSSIGRRFVAVWEDGDRATNNTIVARQIVFNTDGSRQNAATAVVSVPALRSVRNPAVAPMVPERRQLLFAWQEQQGASTSRVVVRTYDVNATSHSLSVVSSAVAISSDAVNAIFPAVAASPIPAHYLVVYLRPASTSPSDTLNVVWGRRIGMNGQPLSAEFQIHTVATDDRTRPRVSYSSVDRSFLVVWADGPASNPQIVGKKVAATTTAASPFEGGSPGEVSPPGTRTTIPGNVDIAYNTVRNDYFVAYRENGNTGNTRITRRRCGLSGGGFTSPENLSGDRSGADRPTTSYAQGLDKVLVAWQDSRLGNLDLYGRIFSYTGAGSGTVVNDESIDFTIASGVSSQTDPVAAFDLVQRNWLVLYAQDFTLRGQRVKVTQ